MSRDELELDREILRTRDRLHEIETAFAAFRMRQDLLSQRVEDLEPRVSALVSAREIADAVDAKIRARGDVIQIRWVGKVVAALIALGTLASLSLQLAHL